MAVTPTTATTFTLLTASTTIATADILVADIGGVTKKMTAGNFRTSLFAFASADPLSIGVLTAVGNSTITGTLSGITTLTATTGVIATVTATSLGVTGASAGATVATVTANDTVTDTSLLVFQRSDGVIAGSIKYSFTNSDLQIGTTTAFPFRIVANNATAMTVGTNQKVTFAASINFGAAVSKIVAGATSLSFRNNSDLADNLIITDAGAITIRNSLTASGGTITESGGSATNAGLKFTPRASDPSTPADGETWVTTAGLLKTRLNGSVKTVMVLATSTGYTAMTNTVNRATAYDTTTITLAQLASRVKAIQDDLTTQSILSA